METKGSSRKERARTTIPAVRLPLIQEDIQKNCDFNGHDADTLMKETRH